MKATSPASIGFLTCFAILIIFFIVMVKYSLVVRQFFLPFGPNTDYWTKILFVGSLIAGIFISYYYNFEYLNGQLVRGKLPVDPDCKCSHRDITRYKYFSASMIVLCVIFFIILAFTIVTTPRMGNLMIHGIVEYDTVTRFKDFVLYAILVLIILNLLRSVSNISQIGDQIGKKCEATEPCFKTEDEKAAYTYLIMMSTFIIAMLISYTIYFISLGLRPYVSKVSIPKFFYSQPPQNTPSSPQNPNSPNTPNYPNTNTPKTSSSQNITRTELKSSSSAPTPTIRNTHTFE